MTADQSALAFWILIAAVVALSLLAIGLIGSVVWISGDAVAERTRRDREEWNG